MPGILLPDAAPAPIAVLLIMLPLLASGAACSATFAAANLAELQRQVEASVRVLLVDESTNPAVVHSFAPAQLPTCVLVYQGVELWRQSGLPNTAEVSSVLQARMLTLNL